jgi:hypothetical protein
VFDDLECVEIEGAGGRRAFSRERVAEAIEVLVALLDVADAPTDGEETGEEDSFMTHSSNGPGCLVADPDFAVDDQGCDPDEGV